MSRKRWSEIVSSTAVAGGGFGATASMMVLGPRVAFLTPVGWAFVGAVLAALVAMAVIRFGLSR